MLAYETHGTGEPLALVHGLATTRVIWRRVLPYLDGRVITLDLPGFGESPPAGDGFMLEEVADVIAAALAEPLDLVGHSLGGAVAIVLAERHPDLVRRLVLVAPAGLRSIPAPAAWVAAVAAAGAIPLRRRAAPLADTPWGRRLLLATGTKDPVSLPPAEVRAMLKASAGATRTREALESVARAQLTERLGALAMPVGAIWGAHDRIVPMPPLDLPVQVIEGAGHIPMMERPEAFARALVTTLKHRAV
ncbi:alpha/beta fold hydrolase [Solirubrobacter soli]|uniref:alpha/beta fold hydrolase n=1 Tax=Solirubrobacter soli TaxID=363832 RepID=UPI0004259727|nr:alpha/beta fold hydrolase [Solirubrobacter soli]